MAMIADATLKRIEGSKKQTPGRFTYNSFSCDTLELSWKQNQHQISCIPKGTYHVEKRKSAKFGEHFWIKDVPNRDMILIHSGNFAAGNHVDILGCIMVGDGFSDINSDSNLDIINSKVTLRAMVKALPDKFTLEIC